MISFPAGHKIFGSRWVYKVRVDNSHKRRVVVLGRGQSPGIDCGSTFAPVCRLQSMGSRWVYKVRADNSHKRRVVVLGRGQSPGIDCGS